MPTYTFRDKDEKEWTEIMSNAEREALLLANPDIEQVPVSFAYADSKRVGVNAKPDDQFRDVLRNIKSKHPGSTINTF